MNGENNSLFKLSLICTNGANPRNKITLLNIFGVKNAMIKNITYK